MRLDNQTDLITRAAAMPLAARARLFASEGASVCVVDINETVRRQVASEIIKASGKAIYVSLDVTEPSHWAEAVVKPRKRSDL
ncbi:MAG TPA: hypothetical protein DDY93_01545 [Dehalococcoidia bacterium]|nr:hypothetical protein [Dehalococcoidia bacterium]